MTDFIDSYMQATASIPSPENYRLWSAISAVAGVLERKVWTQGPFTPVFPNLFVLLVGPPGTGKTNAIRPIRYLWGSIKDMYISPDNVTKAALIDVLSRAVRTITNSDNSAEIFSALAAPCDEFGVFLSKHDLDFLSVLNKIFDCENTHIEERRTSGKVEITKPCLNILGGTQPDFLNSLLPEEAWGMGFASRLLLIYSGTCPKVSFFGKRKLDISLLANRLGQIFAYKGEFTWSNEAMAELVAWSDAGYPPLPTHSRLAHYNTRREINVVKLSMISSASRSPSLQVSVDDFERAKSWLIEAENVMPDVFRSMGQKSDIQIITDLHLHLYRMWSTVAIDKRKPLKTQVIYEYLITRAPSEKIPRLLDVAEKTGYIRKGAYPDEWIPNPLGNFGSS